MAPVSVVYSLHMALAFRTSVNIAWGPTMGTKVHLLGSKEQCFYAKCNASNIFAVQLQCFCNLSLNLLYINCFN